MSKPTRLQEEISGYYLNSKNNFSDNKEANSYLRAISDISSKRGLSHKTRIERIGNLMNYLSENNINLTNFEKSYVEGLLTTSENYISNNSKRIGNSEGVLQNINELRNKLDYSAFKDFNSQIINSSLALEYQQTPSSKISLEERSGEESKYQINPSSGWKRAGLTGKGLLATLGVGAVIAVGAYFVGKSNGGDATQKATISQQQEKILYQEGTIEIRDQKISELQNLVKIDNEIIKNMNDTNKKEVYNPRAFSLEQEVNEPELNTDLTKIAKDEKLSVPDYNSVNTLVYDINDVNSCSDKSSERKVGYIAETGKTKGNIFSNTGNFVGKAFGGLFKSKEEKQEAKEEKILKHQIREEKKVLEHRTRKERKDLEHKAREERNAGKIKRLVDSNYPLNDYRKYLGEKAKQYGREGKHFEQITTGLYSWGALGNEIAGRATEVVAKPLGGASRTIEKQRWFEKLLSFIGIKGPYQSTLKKDDPNENHWQKGAKDAEEFNDFVWRNLWFGPNWNDDQAKFGNFVTGGFLGKSKEEKGILKFNDHNPYSDDPNSTDPYVIEDGPGGLAIRLGSYIAPVVIGAQGGNGGGNDSGITGSKTGGPGGVGGGKGGGAGGSP